MLAALGHWVAAELREHPELAIFLALGVGHWLGALRFGKVNLGSVSGVLIASVLIGQLDITISPQLKSVFFLLFLFAVGYGVGPQFVQGLARDGGPQALFAALIVSLCLGTVYLVARLQHYDAGYAAGLLAGSQTISASLGIATDTIDRANLAPGAAAAALDHLPVAYAITYLWGTFGTGLILSRLGPRLLGVDLPAECRRYEAAMGRSVGDDGRSAWNQIELRAFKVRDGGAVAGLSVASAEQLAHAHARVYIERVRGAAGIADSTPDLVLAAGDAVAVSGRREDLVAFAARGAEEVDDRELLDVPAEQVDLVVTNRVVADHTLAEVAAMPFARGVYVSRIRRGLRSVEVPVLPKTRIQRGDVLTIIGRKTHTRAIEGAIGYADRPTRATDMVWVGLTIVLGGLLGSIVVPVAGVPITLSTSVGTLIAGLVLGWLRSVHPTFGRVPDGAQWILSSLGLNAFIASVGISSSLHFVDGLKTNGIGLLLSGVLATSVPMLLAPLIARYAFRFDPAIALGCCAGARNSTASVSMLGEAAKSSVPMLGYSVPYAVGAMLLTLSGMVIVLAVK